MNLKNETLFTDYALISLLLYLWEHGGNIFSAVDLTAVRVKTTAEAVFHMEAAFVVFLKLRTFPENFVQYYSYGIFGGRALTVRTCTSCELERDPLNWFTDSNPNTCRECLFNNERVSTMTVAFVSLIVAATASRQTSSEYDPNWLSRSAVQVKKAIRQVAETVLPTVAAESRKTENASNIPEQRWLLRQPKGCLHCSSGNMMFSEFDAALNLPLFSSLCKVCLILRGKHLELAEKRKLQAVDDKKRVEAITFKAIEKTRVEAYTITCLSCKIPRDPLKTAVVGALCEHCLDPERAFYFWEVHEAHMKHQKNNPMTRMM